MKDCFRIYSFLFCVVFGSLVHGQISPVSFKKDTTDSAIHLSVRNELPAPVQFKLKVDKLNMSIDTLLLANTSYLHLLAFPLDILEGDSVSLSQYIKTNVLVGDSTAIHDDNIKYQLPFKKGKKYVLIQGFGGKFSHSSDHSKYALDFAMAEGEEVRAARSGTVCYYQEHFSDGGRDRDKYLDKGNRLMILHDDGTIGTYNHLLKDGVLVELGQYVNVGDLIAYSGNTGFSTRPHLHFVVRAAAMSVPIELDGIKTFKKGKKYGR